MVETVTKKKVMKLGNDRRRNGTKRDEEVIERDLEDMGMHGN